MNVLSGIALLYCFAQTTAYTDGDIRLAGINSNDNGGRVEIYKFNVWGTVCNRHFGLQEAKVVCRQLGFPAYLINSSVTVTNSNKYGSGTGLILVDDIDCQGNERRLLNCMLSYWNIDCPCTHADDVGVICQGTTATTPYPAPTWTGLVYNNGKCNPECKSIRLVHPANLRHAGVVQVYRNGQWGTICDTNWDRLDAQVACRMLCYNPAYAVSGSDNFDTSKIAEATTLTNFGCNGDESDLNQCSQSNCPNNGCSRQPARVTCAPMTQTPCCITPVAPPALNCDNGVITVNFTSAWTAFVANSTVELAWTSLEICSARWSDHGTYATFSIPFNQCGTQISANATHIFYNNAILYVPPSKGIITRFKTQKINLKCILPRNYTVDHGFTFVNDSIVATAQGKYQVMMHLYCDLFVTEYDHYSIGEPIYARIELVNHKQQVKVVVRDCYATPTVNRLDPVQYKLFTGRCRDDLTVIFHDASSLFSGFEYESFKFINYPYVYLHCNVYICPVNDHSIECNNNCRIPVGKRRRRESPIEPIYVRGNPIHMEDPENVPEPRPTAQQEAPVANGHGTPTAATTTHPFGQKPITHESDTIIYITNSLPNHNKPARPTSKTIFQKPTTPLADNITGQSTYLSTRVTAAIDTDEISIKQTQATVTNHSQVPKIFTSTSDKPAKRGHFESLVGSGSAPQQNGFFLCLVVLVTVIAGFM